MRYSRFFLPTLKEVPSEAEVISHKLMLRAGMIRKLASGIYSYLPLGLRALRKVESIVRQEMNNTGAQEVMLPLVQPAELWKETGRWEKYGKELLRFKDRHGRDCCLGPTHEEVITDLVRKEVRSYRDLPLCLYQIQPKFRDEIRPRFGLMRGREFVMKDAYSFDVDEQGLDITYKAMYEAYCRIFERCGLDFRPVEADTGTIGGHESHEFMVLAETGEDTIACCTVCNYAANVELAPVVCNEAGSADQLRADEPLKELLEIATPGKKRVEEVTEHLGVGPEMLLKTLVYQTEKGPVVVLLRGDHEINVLKLQKVLGVEEVMLADEDTIKSITGAPVGFAGPLGLSPETKVIGDLSIRNMQNFVTGANKKDAHLVGVNWGRDLKLPELFDLRIITEADPCPRCKGKIELKKGIEVGHIFKLGTKYSEAMGATFLDDKGKERPIVMGCYGIGVGRTVAAAIEQNHDEKGIIFPLPIAPFQVIITVVNIKDDEQMRAGELLYKDMIKQGIEVLIDDREERAGVKFKDSELIGIPIRVTCGRHIKDKGQVEITIRGTGQTQAISLDNVTQKVLQMIEKGGSKKAKDRP